MASPESIGLEVWEAALFPAEPRGRHPPLALVVSQSRILARGHPADAPSEPDAAAALLSPLVLDAVRTQGVPALIRVRDRRLADALGSRRELAGLRFTLADALPRAETCARWLRNPLDPDFATDTTRVEPIGRLGDLSREAVTRLFEAAADLYRVRPWDFMSSEQHLYVDTEAGETYGVSVVGHGASDPGVMVFDDPGDFMTLREIEPPEDGFGETEHPVLIVLFAPLSELSEEAAEELRLWHLPVAGPHAYPELLATNIDTLTDARVDLLAAMLAATARFATIHRPELERARVPVPPVEWRDPATGLTLAYEGPTDAALNNVFTGVRRLELCHPSGPGVDPSGRPKNATDLLSHNLLQAERFELEFALTEDPFQARQLGRVVRRFATFLAEIELDWSSCTELDFRLFLYDILPRDPGLTDSDKAYGRHALGRMAAFLQRKAGLHYRYADAVLADDHAMEQRLRAAPPADATESQVAEWWSLLHDDLDRRGLVPDAGLGDDDVWRPASGGMESWLFWQLTRLWLVWRDEAIAGGIHDPGTVREAALARQRAWEATPHHRLGGRTPAEVVRAERA